MRINILTQPIETRVDEASGLTPRAVHNECRLCAVEFLKLI